MLANMLEVIHLLTNHGQLFLLKLTFQFVEQQITIEMNFHADDGFIFELYTCVVCNAL